MDVPIPVTSPHHSLYLCVSKRLIMHLTEVSVTLQLPVHECDMNLDFVEQKGCWKVLLLLVRLNI